MQQDDGAATASWAQLQRELVMTIEEIEIRLSGKQGASSPPLFTLTAPVVDLTLNGLCEQNNAYGNVQ